MGCCKVEMMTEGGYGLSIEGEGYHSIFVHYDVDEQRIKGITAWGEGSVDVAGIRPGRKLREALMDRTAECEDCDYTICRSDRVEGLGYSCPAASDDEILSCPIEGFAIF